MYGLKCVLSIFSYTNLFCTKYQLTDMTRFYIASDYELMIDIFKGEINFLKSSWQNMLGRPLVVMPLKSIHLGTVKSNPEAIEF